MANATRLQVANYPGATCLRYNSVICGEKHGLTDTQTDRHTG